MEPQTPEQVRLEYLRATVERIEREHEEFERNLEKRFEDYMLKVVFESYRDRLDDRFRPLERVVYGMVSVVLLAVIAAIIKTVVESGGTP